MTYASEVLSDSPLGYWRLGESSGSTMLDSSGNGHTGAYTNVTLGATGLLVGDTDTSGNFPGSSTSRGEVPDAAWMDSTGFTVTALINADSFTSRRAIITRDGPNSSTRGWNLYANVGLLEMFDGSGSHLIGATTMVTGTTYHVALVSTGTTITLYLNGVSDGTATYAVNNTLTNSIMVGASRAGASPGGSFLFNGRIDEALFFTTALSGSRIAAHYAAATAGTPASLTGTWGWMA